MINGVLTPEEYKEVSQDIDTFYQQFTEEDLERAEYYEIEYDQLKEIYEVTLFDENGSMIRTVNFEDFDTAVSVLEEEFDLDDLQEFDYDDQDEE